MAGSFSQLLQNELSSDMHFCRLLSVLARLTSEVALEGLADPAGACFGDDAAHAVGDDVMIV